MLGIIGLEIIGSFIGCRDIGFFFFYYFRFVLLKLLVSWKLCGDLEKKKIMKYVF